MTIEAHSLAMLLQLAQTARDAAIVQRAHAQRAVDAARAQLEQLNSYARDYGSRARIQLANGTDIAAQTNTRAFGGKLDEAVATQLAELSRRETQLARADTELQSLHQRVNSLQTLAERRADALRQLEARREQRSTDELARNAVARHIRTESDW